MESVNEAQPNWLSLIDNKGKLSNCFSINQLAGQKYDFYIIFKETN